MKKRLLLVNGAVGLAAVAGGIALHRSLYPEVERAGLAPFMTATTSICGPSLWIIVGITFNFELRAIFSSILNLRK